MSKKTMKIICSMTIVICLIMSVFSVCFALSVNDIDPTEENLDNGMGTIGSKIATIVRNVGVIVAVVILMVLGIKYMMGSAEEKAEYKKTMIPYLVGAVLLFGASGIATVVVNVTSNITAT